MNPEKWLGWNGAVEIWVVARVNNVRNNDDFVIIDRKMEGEKTGTT